MPRSSGSPFAIGSVSTVTVTFAFVRLAAAPAKTASTTTATDSAATSVRTRRFPPGVVIDAMWLKSSLSCVVRAANWGAVPTSCGGGIIRARPAAV
jgi:hypothetical protein